MGTEDPTAANDTLQTFENLFPSGHIEGGLSLGLERAGLINPAPIQVAAIPPGIRGEPQAGSGCGKTASFVLVCFTKIDWDLAHPAEFDLQPLKLCPEVTVPVSQRLQVLVVAPTREVAVQVADEFVRIGWHFISKGKLAVICSVGGVPIHADLLAMRIRRPQILVATTGRLLSMVQDESSEGQKRIDKRKVSRRELALIKWKLPPIRIVIFEEADRLLTENFQRQTLSIVEYIRAAGYKPQTIFVSATYPPQLLQLTEKIVYTLASVDEAADDSGIYVMVDGISPEPDASIEPSRVLRKCFLVSSFIRHATCEFQEGAVTTQAAVPLRMESTTEETRAIKDQSIHTPALKSVECNYVSVGEEINLLSMCHKLIERLDLSTSAVVDTEEPAATEHPLLRLLVWTQEDPDWNHWPDLLPKFLIVVALLWNLKKQCCLFCNDPFSGQKISMTLTSLGLPAAFVSARMTQAVRTRHIHSMKSGDLKVVVCSDVLARGMDVPEISLVLSVDLPQDKETLLHRIGRTGRFGRDGKCIFIVRDHDELPTLKLMSVQTGFAMRALMTPNAFPKQLLLSRDCQDHHEQLLTSVQSANKLFYEASQEWVANHADGDPLVFLQFCNGDSPLDKQGLPGGGNGIILYRDGSAFVGQVEQGKRCGRGTFIHGPTEVQYDGGWVDDHWDGTGALYSVHDKQILNGQWCHGELEGKRVDLATGMTWIETYENGKLVSQKLVNISPRSLGSTSSSHTSKVSSDEETGPDLAAAKSFGHTIPATSPSVTNLRSRGRTAKNRFAHDFTGAHSTSKYRGQEIQSPYDANVPPNDLDDGSHREDSDELSLTAVSAWSSQRVISWLKSFDAAASVIDAFLTHEVTGQQLLSSITRDSLRRDLGIFAFGYRAKIMEHLKLLKLQICLAEEESHLSLEASMFEHCCIRTSRNQSAACYSRHHSPTRHKISKPATSPSRNTANSARRRRTRKQPTHVESSSSFSDTAPAVCSANFFIPFCQLEFFNQLGVDKDHSSSVYLGRWLGKEIAIKVFTGWLIQPEIWKNYVQLLNDLRHPNIVLVLGVSSRGPDLHCVVLEYAVHQSLENILYGPGISAVLDGWNAQQQGRTHDSICGSNRSILNWVSRLGLQGLPVPMFHKHENRSLLTVTSDEAGSRMPLNQTTDIGQYPDEEQTLLTLGKTEYPATSSICPHIHPYTKLLIPRKDDLPSRLEFDSADSDKAAALAKSARDSLSNPVLLSISKGIALACLYLRQGGVFHLNLKPSNVLIDESFHVRLTDFGQEQLYRAFSNAPLLAPMPRTRRGRGKKAGTPLPDRDLDWSSPEENIVQCPLCKDYFDGRSALVVEATVLRDRRINWCAPEVLRVPLRYHGFNEASDVYSFGVILWNLLTGLVPFVGLSPTQIRVAVGYAGLRIPLASVWPPLQKLLTQCLSFSPELRPSFDEILHGLLNVHQSANSTAEDALIAFMQGGI